MTNPVRTTTLKVIKQAKDIRINQERVREIARKWTKSKLIVPSWPFKYHLQTRNQKKMLDYLILLDAINFCFWSKKKKWQIKYKGKKYDGYFALSLALRKFFEENPEKANLNYFSKIPFKEFKEILQDGKNLLFLEKRWQIARAVSKTLIERYENSENFVKSAKQEISILVSKIYQELPFFDDISNYKGEEIYFLKRAQILAADIWGAFRGREIGHFKDLDYLTCFPDYKIPQILHHFGILEYSSALEKKIKNKIIIPKGSIQEIEIRSGTVWGIEYLKNALEKLGKRFYSFEVDWILWNKNQFFSKREILPYHLTKTIFY